MVKVYFRHTLAVLYNDHAIIPAINNTIVEVGCAAAKRGI